VSFRYSRRRTAGFRNFDNYRLRVRVLCSSYQLPHDQTGQRSGILGAFSLWDLEQFFGCQMSSL
jgi:hypothetical protein